jgi:hypothetical protein
VSHNFLHKLCFISCTILLGKCPCVATGNYSPFMHIWIKSIEKSQFNYTLVLLLQHTKYMCKVYICLNTQQLQLFQTFFPLSTNLGGAQHQVLQCLNLSLISLFLTNPKANQINSEHGYWEMAAATSSTHLIVQWLLDREEGANNIPTRELCHLILHHHQALADAG